MYDHYMLTVQSTLFRPTQAVDMLNIAYILIVTESLRVVQWATNRCVRRRAEKVAISN